MQPSLWAAEAAQGYGPRGEEKGQPEGLAKERLIRESQRGSERRRRRRRNRTTQGPDSCVLSSGDEDSEGDVCVASTFSAYLNKLKDGTASPRPPGTVTCPICMDVHTEIIQSGRVIVATKCGHVFCSQCLRDAMKNSSTCPTCRKKLTHKQYHPIYI
ncbi:hypothetical protein NDU88_001473 [Pleurodeles waltl]|uniref:RING-type domain-containing protein n=1 Tax=Pleurodeles waltl TaxID=8319 RepID=A0AAV7WIF6_PLEWA|nr:hypothetical protein NDU88_001473 [Pleurodeles waltl]